MNSKNRYYQWYHLLRICRKVELRLKAGMDDYLISRLFRRIIQSPLIGKPGLAATALILLLSTSVQAQRGFPGVFNLSSFTSSNGLVLTRGGTFFSNVQVGEAGDINDDGFADMLIWENGPINMGDSVVYVLFGKEDFESDTIDLSNLNGTDGFQIKLEGPIVAGDNIQCTSVDDFNGDDIADLAFTIPNGGRTAGSREGLGVLLFGSDGSFPSVVSTSSLDGSNGFIITSENQSSLLGLTVNGPGDVNNDGFDDLMLGATDSVSGGPKVYILFGDRSPFPDSVNINGVQPDETLLITEFTGTFLPSGGRGDITGDRVPDILIGDPASDPPGRGKVGEAYIVFGRNTPFPDSITRTEIKNPTGFVVTGLSEDDQLGSSLSMIGDVNNDGVGDFVIGAEEADPSGLPGAGEAYVVFGRAGTFQDTIDLTSLNGLNGFRIPGIISGGKLGRLVGNAGDFNGDGISDLFLGAPTASFDGGNNQGEAYILFGQDGGFSASFDLAAMDGSQGFRIRGGISEADVGEAISEAGDVNRDGFDDLIIGSQQSVDGDSKAYVLLGTCSVTRSSLSATVCDSYTGPSGRVFTTSGLVVDTLTNAVGCDSLIDIDLTVLKSTSVSIIQTTCDTFISPGGKVLTQSGIYQDTIPNAVGCDSLIQIDLTINRRTEETETVSACDSFTWSTTGITYTESGFYRDTLSSIFGCDSIRNLNLTIQNSSTASETISVCGQFITPSGKLITTSGTINDTIPNSAGCDSVITLDITILPSEQSILSITACDSYTWPHNGQTFSESGIYTDTLTNQSGCDSILTLDLEVLVRSFSTLNVTVCSSYTSPSGKVFMESGLFKDTIPNQAGCDSIITLNLNIGNTSIQNLEVESCGSYLSPNGNLYTSSGIYRDTISSSVGCDSILLIDLTVTNAISLSENITACESYTWSANGVTYSQSGIFRDTTAGASGCDTIRQLALTINRGSSGSESVSACGSYTWPANGITYVTSGTYTAVLSSGSGCDSLATLNLTIDQVEYELVTSSGFFIVAAEGATLQWLDCDDGYAPVNGATGPTFTPPGNGEYAVEVSKDGCVDTSNCVSLVTTSLNEPESGIELRVFPNPTTGRITIGLGKPYSDVRAILRNTVGQVVGELALDQTEQFDMNVTGPAGIYTLEVWTKEEQRTVLRIMKE